MNYNELMVEINKGLELNDIEVNVNGDWISWQEATKILKGLDFGNVTYRRKDAQSNS